MTAHLWQSTFFALAAGLLTLVFRKNRASVRYWLWMSASLKFFIPFGLLLNLGRYLEMWMPLARRIATPLASHSLVSYTLEQFSGTSFAGSLPVTAPAPATNHWTPIVILSVWLCGFAAVALIRFRNWLRVRAAVRTSTTTNIHATNMPATVEVRVSPGLLEPGVVGLVRPILLLPAGIAERLTPSELNAVLAHEFCHIRRRDNLFAAIHMMVEAIFWFHPLVWWIGARLVDERERACDEAVLNQGNPPEVYADAILNICKLYVESPLACVSGVSGAGIRQRIETIMSNRKLHGLNRAKKLLLATAGFAALCGPIAVGLLIGAGSIPAITRSPGSHAQPPVAAPAPPIQLAQAQTPPANPSKLPAAPQPPAARPKFDVVSVKRCMPGDELNGPPGGRGGGGGGRGPRYSPGRLRMQCLDVADMIRIAYLGLFGNGLLNFSAPPGDTKWLRNAPAWVNSDWYTIDAETEDPAANKPDPPGQRDSEKVMEQMLQVVLEDRFQLKIHRDTEDVPMYDLTVAKGGLKLKPMEPGGCFEHDPTRGTDVSDMFPPGKTPMCTIWLHMNGPDWALDAAGQSPGNLVGMLGTALNRHVFDKTGVKELYVFHLQFAHDETTPGNFPPQMMADFFPSTDVPSGPSIFTVLERIGLKLAPVKGPQGYIVVDHVERPSEN